MLKVTWYRVTFCLLLCSGVSTGTPEEESPSPCGDQEVVEVLGARTLADGGVEAGDGSRFPPGCTWISHPPDSPIVTYGCPSKVNPCLWQCCPEGQSFNKSFKCQPSNVTLSPLRPTAPENFDITKFHVLHGNPCAYRRYLIKSKHLIDIKYDGSLTEVSSTTNNTNYVASGKYCGDISGENKTTVLACCLTRDCKTPPPLPPSDDEPRDPVTHVIYSVCRIVTLPFLVATVVVYAVIPQLRNLHGKCLMSHVGSLTVAYVFLLVVQLASQHLRPWFCVTSAFVVYFFLLVSFFWLNVMCFDIWWTFSGYSGMSGRKVSKERKEFFYYSLYSWGAASVMLCVTLVMHFSPSVPDSVLKPGFGDWKCWFTGKTANLAYFSGPVIVLLVINVAFFCLTAYNICKIKKDTAILSQAESGRSNLKRNSERFVLYLKFFVVMGVTWTLDMLGWAIGGPDFYWYLFDIANIMQGIPIFIIFVWKPSVRKLLRERFCKKPSTKTLAESPTNTTTDSSGGHIAMT